MANITGIVVNLPTGEGKALADYGGQVLLIVNVASYCGYTAQYKGLEALYQTYKSQGFELLAFPCNDFGAQEPDSHAAIAQFCAINYGIQFPLFDKLHAKGPEQSPLYGELVRYDDEPVAWNFEKFLVDRSGEVVGHFKSGTTPESAILTDAIEQALAS